MKLYDVPRNTRIRIDGIELLFVKLDGAYSICQTDDGETVHLAAWADVEVVE